MLSLCVAMDQNRLIGCGNTLPWYLPADLKHFRALTMGKPVIMGRKTYESIGHPLPGRYNIILTHNPYLTFPGCQVLHQLDEVLALSQQYPESIVIGGAAIYETFLPKIQRMYITWVHTHSKGDTYFPDYPVEQWQLIEKKDYPANSHNAHPYSFTVLTRVKSVKV